MVRTEIDRIEKRAASPEFALKPCMDSIQLIERGLAARENGLVRNQHDPKFRFIQSSDGFANAGKKFELIGLGQMSFQERPPAVFGHGVLA
jgi:hypothetical protein